METLPQSLVKRAPIFRNVQALRALAATLVVFEHMGHPVDGIETHYFPGSAPIFRAFTDFGLFGVDLFFAISGFIMVTTTWESFAKKDASWSFFLRRCIRIYPPYWLVLVPLTFVYLRVPDRLTLFHKVHVDLLSSFFLLPHTGQSLLAVSWTLVYELFFYVVFALLLFFHRSFVLPALIAWFFAELALYGLFHNVGTGGNALLEFLGHPTAIEFIFGAFVGLAYVHRRFPAPIPIAIVSVIAFFVLWPTSWHLGHMPTIERVFVFGIPAGLIVYSAVAIEATAGFQAPKWAVSVGDSSYALYLWHLPVIIALAQLASRVKPHGFFVHAGLDVVMLVVLYTFSAFVYRYVETPMTKYLNKVFFPKKSRPEIVAPAAQSA